MRVYIEIIASIQTHTRARAHTNSHTHTAKLCTSKFLQMATVKILVVIVSTLEYLPTVCHGLYPSFRIACISLEWFERRNCDSMFPIGAVFMFALIHLLMVHRFSIISKIFMRWNQKCCSMGKAVFQRFYNTCNDNSFRMLTQTHKLTLICFWE